MTQGSQPRGCCVWCERRAARGAFWFWAGEGKNFGSVLCFGVRAQPAKTERVVRIGRIAYIMRRELCLSLRLCLWRGTIQRESRAMVFNPAERANGPSVCADSMPTGGSLWLYARDTSWMRWLWSENSVGCESSRKFPAGGGVLTPA